MDLANASTTDGTVIQLARCNGGWAQRFTLNGSHDLVNPTANRAVDLVLMPCNGSDPQKWSKS